MVHSRVPVGRSLRTPGAFREPRQLRDVKRKFQVHQYATPLRSAESGDQEQQMRDNILLLSGVIFDSAIKCIITSKPSDGRRGRVFFARTFDFDAHVTSMSPGKFARLYRLSTEDFMELHNLILPYIRRKKIRKSKKNSTVDTRVMLCITMRLLAGGTYLSNSWPFGVGFSTVYPVFEQSLNAIDKALQDNMRFPTTREECHEESRKFRVFRRSPLDGIISAIDGIAVAIRAPRLDEVPDPRKYYNRKKFHAICVQTAVGADYMFQFVSARHAGSTHDSTAFQATRLYHEIVKGSQLPDWAIIAADEAYSNEKHVMTPFGGRGLSQAKLSFNYHLSKCRVTVEQV